MENTKNSAVGVKRMSHNRPLTPEQQDLAALHHQLILSYLRRHKLDDMDWYDMAVFGYLRAVRNYTERPELQKYAFTTIAERAMDSACGNERKKRSRRIDSTALSLDASMTDDGMTLYDIIGSPEFLPFKREDDVAVAQYMPLLDVLTKQQLAVLTMKAQGYTYREIAEALGYNTAAAASSAAERGRKAILRAEEKRSRDLKSRTDMELGYVMPIDLFRECEEYARRKLALARMRTGDESYDEAYLVKLLADVIKERAFSRYTVKLYELTRMEVATT